jgi:hypothetical protein
MGLVGFGGMRREAGLPDERVENLEEGEETPGNGYEEVPLDDPSSLRYTRARLALFGPSNAILVGDKTGDIGSPAGSTTSTGSRLPTIHSHWMQTDSRTHSGVMVSTYLRVEKTPLVHPQPCRK